jgi:hypothetical protein
MYGLKVRDEMGMKGIVVGTSISGNWVKVRWMVSGVLPVEIEMFYRVDSASFKSLVFE